MKLLAAFAIVAGIAGAQAVGPAINVLFPSGLNTAPASPALLASPDGTYVATRGSLPTIADVVVTEVGPTGLPGLVSQVTFPDGNDVHATNGALVMSRQGRFLCCYGSDATTGDLVFITRNALGDWVATNVVFPSSNDSPNVGTRPAISDDESFIVCRGLSGIADIVIVPVVTIGGLSSPGVPFAELPPDGNTVAFQAVDPVIAPDSRSFAIAGANPLLGDLVVGAVASPATAAGTVLFNVPFPASNNLLSVLVPPAASPRSNYYAAHGSSVAVADLVVVPIGPGGVPGDATNVAWPSNNTASTTTPPQISGDGRLVAVNGVAANVGDVVLLPVDPDGVPGTPFNVLFPASNNLANTLAPPVVASDARLVVQRGAPTVGDLVAIQVAFVSPTTIVATAQNVLYPAGNDVVPSGSHVALAPDRSFAATTGQATLGDLVITPFDESGIALGPVNVLYPASNNVPIGTTPRISREGNLVMTPGASTIGDAVVTGIDLDPDTGLVLPAFTVNVLYPAANGNFGSPPEPVFAPTTTFAVAAGAATFGDLVLVPLLDPFPRFLARADVGTSVPVRFLSPGDAGLVAIGAASLDRHPGTMLPAPDGRVVPLVMDALFTFSTNPLNPVFLGFSGVLGPGGVYDGASIDVPPLPFLHGERAYVAFVVLDPTAPIGIGTISRASVFLIE
jgi:hypothetical protein